MKKAIKAYSELEDHQELIPLKSNLATVKASIGDIEGAKKLCDEIAESTDDPHSMASVDSLRCQMAYKIGDYAVSVERAQRALAGFRQVGNQHGAALAINNRAHALRQLGRFEEARAAYTESLEIRLKIRDTTGVIMVMEGVSKLCAAEARTEAGARLASMAEELRNRLHLYRNTFDRAEWDQSLERLRAGAGESFEFRWSDAMGREEADVFRFLEKELTGRALTEKV